jgi:hypothetical protein
VIALLALHGAASVGVWMAASFLRKRPFSLVWGIPDFLVALLIPGVGMMAAGLSLALEVLFRRRGDPRCPADLFDHSRNEAVHSGVHDPVAELQAGTRAAPFGETLEAGDLDEVDRALRRLVRDETPPALGRLREALRSPRRDVRVRARGLLVRLEDRLSRQARDGASELDRARAFRTLALLSTHPETARQHLGRAVEEYRIMGRRSPSTRVNGELAAVLWLRGDLAASREALLGHLHYYPADVAALRLLYELDLRMGDRESARRVAGMLAIADPQYAELARRWYS